MKRMICLKVFLIASLMLCSFLGVVSGCGTGTPSTTVQTTLPVTTTTTTISSTTTLTTLSTSTTTAQTSVYDGTYTGHFNYRWRVNESEGGGIIKPGSWTAVSMTLQITFKTEKLWPNNAGEILLDITHLVCDDPGFGVVGEGAAALSPSQAILPANPPFSGTDASLPGLSIYIEFPNGARFMAEGVIVGDSGTLGAMTVSADGQTISSTTEPSIQYATWSAWDVPSGILSNWGKQASVYQGEDERQEMPPEGMEFSFDSWSLTKN